MAHAKNFNLSKKVLPSGWPADILALLAENFGENPMTKFTKIAPTVALASGMAVAAQADTLFDYTFTGADPAGDLMIPTPLSGISLTAFTSAGGVTQTATNDVFNSTGFALTADPSKFVTFSITADTPGTLTLTSLTFDTLRSTTGPLSGTISLFLNGSLTAAESFNYGIGTSNANINFDFVDVTGLNSAEFRFFASGGSSTAGTMRLDNVTGLGTIAPIPEPSVYMLLGVGILLCSQRFLRRRKSA